MQPSAVSAAFGIRPPPSVTVRDHPLMAQAGGITTCSPWVPERKTYSLASGARAATSTSSASMTASGCPFPALG